MQMRFIKRICSVDIIYALAAFWQDDVILKIGNDVKYRVQYSQCVNLLCTAMLYYKVALFWGNCFVWLYRCVQTGIKNEGL